jgi:hypothetical protein
MEPWVDAVSMLYHLSFDQKGAPTYSMRRHRLVKRVNRFRWHGAVHEYLQVGGQGMESDVAVSHMPMERDPNCNFDIYDKKLARGESFSLRDLYYSPMSAWITVCTKKRSGIISILWTEVGAG